ncbi:MAG: hypothetical protein LQ346_005042 [Caloplaca aetnensis]|nr:MAG: hypothetical protein LQ346_005042 [Caloplaca aetnensis]
MALRNTCVSVFYPSQAQAASNLRNATIFTRIHILATPKDVKTVLESTPTIQETFCLRHLNNVLIFDSDEEEHISHVRAVLRLIGDNDMEADTDDSMFHKRSWMGAGFRIALVDGNHHEAFMVALLEHLAPDAFEDVG